MHHGYMSINVFCQSRGSEWNTDCQLRFSISCNVFQICPLPTGTVITVVYSPFLSLCLVLGDKVAMYITVTITEGTWLYCDYFIWWVSCIVVVLTCFVMYVCVCVCMCGFCNVCVYMCGCFGNMCTCIYSVLYCLYCVFVLFRLCTFILICFVCKDYCNRVTTQLQ